MVIFFLSPQEELAGDDTIAVQKNVWSKKECHSAQAGEETGGHAGC